MKRKITEDLGSFDLFANWSAGDYAQAKNLVTWITNAVEREATIRMECTARQDDYGDAEADSAYLSAIVNREETDDEYTERLSYEEAAARAKDMATIEKLKKKWDLE